MILENWSALEVIVGIVITAPVVYAWADRWLDRTRKEPEKED